MEKKTYKQYVKAVAPKSPIIKDCIFAFFVGGGICMGAEGLVSLYKSLGLDRDGAGTLCSVTLIFLAVIFTGIGIFDNIAKHAGAGTLVPITGFANAVASPAIDSRGEGTVTGVGAKIFTVSGPVILYGIFAGFVYGVIYYFIGLII